MDTSVVNGEAYPYLDVEPRAYRFRVLNAADDRFYNLQLYVADTAGYQASGYPTEMSMVPASPNTGLPANWPTDGRDGGVPNPATVGPSFIQIGTEGGFLPEPVVVPNQPITWVTDPTVFNAGNVDKHALLLSPAERADVVVDFSQYAGKTLILYNDAPAAFPALDGRYDYYTGHPDMTDTGGAPTTQAGYGPNTRTVLQIRVGGTRHEGHVRRHPREPEVGLREERREAGRLRGLAGPDHLDPGRVQLGVRRDLPGRQLRADLPEGLHVHDPRGHHGDGPPHVESHPGRAGRGVRRVRPAQRLPGAPGWSAPTGQQQLLLYGYESPPIDIMSDTVGTKIGEAGDGTQILEDHAQRRGHPPHPLAPGQHPGDQPGRLGRHHPGAGRDRAGLEGDPPGEPARGHDRGSAAGLPLAPVGPSQQRPPDRPHRAARRPALRVARAAGAVLRHERGAGDGHQQAGQLRVGVRLPLPHPRP